MKLKWQPIETAPKDGSYILGWSYSFNRSVELIRWNEEENCFEFEEDCEASATHWMPLPEPPASPATIKIETPAEEKATL